MNNSVKTQFLQDMHKADIVSIDDHYLASFPSKEYGGYVYFDISDDLDVLKFNLDEVLHENGSYIAYDERTNAEFEIKFYNLVAVK